MHCVPGVAHLVAGRYRLLDQLGRGAMGIVWHGHDELLDREVAIKQIVQSPLTSQTEAEASFQRTIREARAAARLSHPGVVTIFDVIEEDGSPWIVMELICARPLDQLIAEDGPLPPAQAAKLGLGLLEALATAHAAGVLHRDVKPSNVLIRPDATAVLTDFGIATRQGDPGLTQAGMVVGTPGFTAPERVRGNPATPSSDLWSLGATLYAAVEGHGPFDRAGGATAIIASIVTEPAPPAPSAGPLAQAIEALLRADPAERPDPASAARLLVGAVSAARAAESAGTVGRTAVGGAGSRRAGHWSAGQRPAEEPRPAPSEATTATQAVAALRTGARPSEDASDARPAAPPCRAAAAAPAAPAARRTSADGRTARRRRGIIVAVAFVIVVAGIATVVVRGLTGSAPHRPVRAALGVGGASPTPLASHAPRARHSIRATRPAAGSPQDPQATAGAGFVKVSWRPPNGGGPVKKYRVRINPPVPGATQTVTGSTSVRVAGLSCAVTYSFTVYSISAGGRQAPAQPVGARPCVAPGAVGGLDASVSSHQVSLSWSAASSGGGRVRYSVSWGGGSHVEATGTSTTIGGLTNFRTYHFRVTASNQLGHGRSTTKSVTLSPGQTWSYNITGNWLYPVHVRTAPSQDASVLGQFAPTAPPGPGVGISVICQVIGATYVDPTGSPSGNIWDLIVYGSGSGYVADAYTTTPNSGSNQLSPNIWTCK